VVEPVQPGRFIAFSTFEVDLHAAELRKAGKRLKLTGQPFQVLAILLERAGDVVTRDELQKRLWPDTFVDVDHNLNTAINKIREVLGDSAENPRFVETLPRRGYRFIGEIRQQAVAIATPQSTETSGAKWRNWPVGVAAIGICGVILLGVSLYRSRDPLPRAPRVLRYGQLTNDARPKVVLNFPWSIQLVSNGPRIYFSQIASGLDSHVFAEIPSASASDGSTTSIRTPFEWPIPTAVSPDGSQLLAMGGMDPWDRPLWVISLPSGTSRRLGTLVGHDASWSPDGRTIVFAKNHELFQTDTNGSTLKKLATLADGVATLIRWSPDGTRLRFTVTDNLTATGSSSIWQISNNGTELQKLFPAQGDSQPQECCGNWTADGEYFVFQAARDGVTGIWAIREGSRSSPNSFPSPFQLTSGPIRFTSPLPSKDGKQIFAIGEQLRGELTRFDLKSQKFVRYLSGISAEQLNFSKDGQWVTYVTYPEGVLWRSKIDGSQRQQLTVPPLQASAPRWSPNGQQIVFAGYMPGEKNHLYLIAAEGGSPEAITTSSAVQPAVGDPQWSPDGNSVMFFEVNDLGLDRTSRLLLLDLHNRQVSPLPASEGHYSPRWSPDGRNVVALTWDGRKLQLFDVQSQKWSDLASGSLGWPEWSADGKYVSYIDIESLAYSRVSVTDRKVERVANLEQARGLNAGRYWSYYGAAPDGSPVVLRNTGIQEIYALDVDFP
jgi:Tol biopolymer transport system component/DNA-binding winged helix-turn-helix (wHTH) protein